MKIIQIINALTFGGAQVILLDLVKKLQTEKHEVLVLAFKDGPIGKKLRERGCAVKVLGENLLDLLAFVELRKTIASFKPDLVHSHLFKATFWARMSLVGNRRVRLITSVHGSETSYYHSCERFTARLSHYFIFPSHFMRHLYCRQIAPVSRQRTAVIYPGVDIIENSDLKQPANKLVIGTLSRLHPVKGVDTLIRAAALLKQSGISFQLLIGGDGRQKTDLQNLAHHLDLHNECCFTGEVDDVKGFLSGLDIFVAASRQEAFGIHVCEAMERGIPVVAAEVGGLPEMVENGCSGMLFPVDDHQALADRINQLIATPELRKKIAEASRQKVIAGFNRKIAVQKHLEVYEKSLRKVPKIHFVLSSRELGGGERLALSLMQGLSLREMHISATCCGNPLSEALRKSGIERSVARLNLGGILFAIRLLLDLLKNKPDLISTHLNKAGYFAGVLGRILRIPVVSHVHGLNRKSYYSFSNHLIAVSSAVKQHLIDQGVEDRKISVVKNCIGRSVAKEAKELQLPLKICILAKLHHNKGHAWAIRALLQNRRALPDFELHIVGDGPERANLQKLCAELKAGKLVKFHGYINDTEHLLKEMHVALLPSLGEGIPLSLLEAIALGIPCIATRVGGVPEIVVNGENGLLIESENEIELTNALMKMADPKIYRCLSFGALKSFKHLNDFDAMLDATAAIFSRQVRE